MPAVQMFKSQSGKVFDNAFDEHRDDLACLIGRLVDNEPLGKQLADKLSNGVFQEFAGIVQRMKETRPENPVYAEVAKPNPVLPANSCERASDCLYRMQAEANPGEALPRSCIRCGIGPCPYGIPGE